MLQIAAVLINIDEQGKFYCSETVSCHVNPFEGANLDPKSMEVNGIDVDHPFRLAVDEKQALPKIFKPVRTAIKQHQCNKAILVGHNAHFDLKFINAAAARSGIKRNPFHPFSTIDTVSLAALAYGQTVLARSVQSAGLAVGFERGSLGGIRRRSNRKPVLQDSQRDRICAALGVVLLYTDRKIGPVDATLRKEDLSIIVVDDLQFSREVVKSGLGKSGFTDIRTASSADEALYLLNQRRAHVVLADFWMPGMNGLEMTDLIRRWDENNDRYTGIVLLTAEDTASSIVVAFDRGVDDFISKSANQFELAARVFGAGRTAFQQNEMRERMRRLSSQFLRAKQHSLQDP